MVADEFNLAWNLVVELRKELIETQKIRAQVIGFKITFVSTAIGLIAANFDKIPSQLFIIPAFAAIFFDLLITSYSFSIKRIGAYCKNHLEPILRKSSQWPDKTPLWEEFATSRHRRQSFSLIGNLGITTISVIPAILALFHRFNLFVSMPILLIIIMLFVYDVVAFTKPRRVVEDCYYLKD